MDFGLSQDVPGHALDEAWQTLLAEHIRALEATLARVAETVDTVTTGPR